MNREAIKERRSYPVAKANDIIQQAKYSLTAAEQRALAFIISAVRESDTEIKTYTFAIRDYCQVCGMDPELSENREAVKKSVERLGKAAFWFKTEDRKEILRFWVDPQSIVIDWQKGVITVALSNWLSGYLLGLKRNYTTYSLASILPMQSAYSIRLFEICRSYLYKGVFTVDLDKLKEQLVKDNTPIEKFYPRWPDFKRRVLEQAEQEINTYSEILVSWVPETTGNKVTGVTFTVSRNDKFGRHAKYWEWEDRVDGVSEKEAMDDFLTEQKFN